MSEKKYKRKQKKFNKTVDQVVEGIDKKHKGGGRTKKEDRKQERKMKKMEKTAEQLSEIRAKQKDKKGPGKMPDGYNMKRPAEKLGYIQQLGAGRMSPGKMGDMTAMKMMHGDAAAKYYDGAGMYMNGAPKYEGASKSYVGPMDAGHGGAPGHGHGDDRPSYTKQTTTTSVVPGTKSSTSTTTSGGSGSGRTKFSSDPEERAKQKQWIKDNPEAYKKALAEKKKKSAGSTSSSSSSTSSKPTVKTEVKKEKITSKRKSGSQVMSEGREAEMNRMARHKAGRAEKMNIAKADSARIAKQRLKGRKLTEKSLTAAVKAGNIAGAKTMMGYGDDRGSFGEKGRGRAGEFSFTRDEAQAAFPTNIGKATGTSIGKGKGKGTKFEPGQEFGLKSSNYTASDIGKVKDFSKKGQYKISDVKTDAGTAGSYGGYSSAKEYMDALNKGGSPKMPKGPMKFGMRK